MVSILPPMEWFVLSGRTEEMVEEVPVPPSQATAFLLRALLAECHLGAAPEVE